MIIVYQDVPPDGWITAFVILLVVVVAMIFYVPRFYRNRYQALAVTYADPSGGVHLSRDEFDHVELDRRQVRLEMPSASSPSSGGVKSSASVPEIRFAEQDKVLGQYHAGE